MRLSDAETEAALYCVNEIVDRRARAGVPIPDWMRRLARKLDLASTLSADGHENNATPPSLDEDALIGSREAANILSVTARQVRRLAADLDGRKSGRDWIFTLTTVTEYAKERRNG